MRRSDLAAVAIVAAGILAWAPIARATEYVVAPEVLSASDDGPGKADKPFRTLAKALAVAKGGDVVLLADGKYPVESITTKYAQPLVLRAAKGARPQFVGGLSLQGAAGVRVYGVKFTWTKDTRPAKNMAPFIAIVDARDIEIGDCEITDDPTLTEWVGWACQVSKSEKITVRDTKVHHVYFGLATGASKDVTFRNLDIGPWSHEDGIRVSECLGPVLVDGCHITNTGIAGRKGGHVDAIQVVFWSDNLTIRNCHIHGVAQAIGAFRCVDPRASIPDRRRKNWRIEGNLIYDVYTPHYATVCETDGIVVANNTFPQGAAIVSKCTAAVVRNNIFGAASVAKEPLPGYDYNLWIGGGRKLSEHDLVGVDPRFASGETAFFKIDSRHVTECTRTKLYPREMKGRLAQGDLVEVVMTDGSRRDGRMYKVTAVGDGWIEIDPALPADPGRGGVLIYKWPAGTKHPVPDYHLRPDSPAIDSADGNADRVADMDGHKPTDVPGVPDTGGGKVPYLDRGAFEYVPPAR